MTDPTRTRFREWGLPLLLGALAVAVYANSLGNGFAFDDVGLVLHNERVHDLGRLWELLTEPYWPITAEQYGLYRPLTLVTFALDWALWGGRASGFHLVNVVLHAGVTFLVFDLLRRLEAPRWAAGLGATVFAVHPVHVEAVATVVGRAELLAAAFFLLGVLVYLRSEKGWRGALLAAAVYFLALTSKEMAVTLPALLLLLEARGEGGLRGAAAALRRRGRTFAALGATFAVYMALRYAVTGALVGSRPSLWFWDNTWRTSFFTGVRLWPELLRLMLFPAELVSEYGPAVIVPESGLSVLVLAGIVVGVAALAVTAVSWRRAPLVGVGIAWFILTVLPVSGLLFPVEFMLAERTLYLPSIAVALGTAGLLERLRAERPRWLRPAVATLAILLMAGAARTWTRTPVWESSETVLRDLVVNHPASYRAQWALALQARKHQRYDDMLRRYRTAVRMAPRYFNLRYEYARELLRVRAYDQAAAQFDTLRIIDPHHRHPPTLRLRSLINGGRPEQAVEEGARLAEQYPDNPGVYHELSRALARLGRWGEAGTRRLETIHRTPVVHPYHWIDLAGIRLLQGDSTGAAAALDSARAARTDSLPVPSIDSLGTALEAGERGVLPFW